MYSLQALHSVINNKLGKHFVYTMIPIVFYENVESFINIILKVTFSVPKDKIKRLKRFLFHIFSKISFKSLHQIHCIKCILALSKAINGQIIFICNITKIMIEKLKGLLYKHLVLQKMVVCNMSTLIFIYLINIICLF